MKPLKLPLRLILLSAMLIVSIVPIGLFSYWTIQNALAKEFSAVNEKHLLLAHNITTALDRYAVDAIAVFDTGVLQAKEQHFHAEQTALMQQLDIEAFAKYDHNGALNEHFFGNKALTPESLNTITIEPKTAGFKSSFSTIKTFPQHEPVLYLYKQDSQQNTWIAAINTSYISHIQMSISFGDKGHAAIVDQQGAVLAHPNKAWQQQAKDISKISIVQSMMEGRSGVEQFYSPAMEADMIAGYSTVPTTGWGVMIPQPTSELSLKLQDVKQVTLYVALSCLIIISLLSWWISGLVVKPVKQLIKMTQDLSQHQALHKVKEDNRLVSAEVGSLIESFHEMAIEVDKGQKELERRVTERTEKLHKAEQKARHLASHDQVTGLPNRIAIREDAQHRINKGEKFSLLFIDLDNFKPVNDQYGHQMGDRLLKAFGERLQSHLGNKDKLARYGGDEFIILLHTDNATHSENIAEQLLAHIRYPFSFEELDISIHACIGLVQSVEKTHDLDQLIHQADLAMYDAKKSGKNCLICV